MRDAPLARTVDALRRVLATMVAGHERQAVLALSSNVLVSLLPAVLAYVSQTVVDALIAGPSHAPGAAGLSRPLLLGLIYVALLAIQQSLHILLLLANETLTEAGARNLHVAIMAAGARLEGLQRFEDSAFHDRRLLLENHALSLPVNCLRFATDLLGVGVAVLAMGALLSSLHVAIPLIMLAASAPDVISQIKAHRLRYEGIKETAEDERRRDYYRSVLLEPAHAKDVRVYGLKDYFLAQYAGAFERMLAIVTPIRERQLRQTLLSRLAATAGTIAPYVWTVVEAGRGHITAGQLVMSATAITVIHQQLLRAAQTIAAHQEVIHLAREFAAWTDTRQDDAIVERVPPVRRPHRVPPAVRVEQVWFHYPGAADFTLRGLDLEIAAGRSLAIVGRNGSGKSTLVKLLCRLYDPQRGAISYDGVDIRDVAIDDLRRSSAVIFQDFVRYQLPVTENIALRHVEDGAGLDAVKRAAEMAGADEMIRRLPGQYHAQLGREQSVPAGVELSGGEWQRVALARALGRDAGLLIMDEPTASLDISTEARLYTQFKHLTQHRTTLLISHRLASVRQADRIAVMDHGRLVEFGDHDSLMAARGIYEELFTIQAERYRPGAGYVA